MSLYELAMLAVRPEPSEPRTPLLVVPRFLSLKRGFFLALCDDLIKAYAASQSSRGHGTCSRLRCRLIGSAAPLDSGPSVRIPWPGDGLVESLPT